MKRVLLAAIAALFISLPLSASTDDDPPELRVENGTQFPVHIEVDSGYACDLDFKDDGDCVYGPDVDACNDLAALAPGDHCVRLDLSTLDHTVVVKVHGKTLTATAHLKGAGKFVAFCLFSETRDGSFSLTCQ